MLPQHISVGLFTLNLYTALVGLGALAALAWCLWRTRNWDLLNYAIIVGVGALAAGRVGYVALHWGYYAEHGDEILSLASPSPGFQEHFALLGAWLACKGLSKKAKSLALGLLPFAFCLFTSCIGIAASIGCIPNGCAYGKEVFWVDGAAWLLRVDWPDAYTINNPRLPTQLFMAAWQAGILLISKKVAGRSQKFLPLYFLLFAAGDFAFQFLRGDAGPLWFGLRAAQWLDLGIIAFAVLAIRAKPQ
jgi:prolipoprotein diacylglyceryltransferase